MISWVSELGIIRWLIVALMISAGAFVTGCEKEDHTKQNEFFQIPGTLGDEPASLSTDENVPPVSPELEPDRFSSQVEKQTQTKTDCLIEISVSPPDSLVTIDQLKIVADSDSMFRVKSSQPLTNIVVSHEGYQSHTNTLKTEKQSLVKLVIELKQDPKFLLTRASEQMANRDLVAALGSAAVAMELQPNSFEAVRLQSEILVRMGHPELARQRLAGSYGWANEQEVRKELVRIAVALGTAHQEQGNWSSAVAEFERAISLDAYQRDRLVSRILGALTQEAQEFDDASRFTDAIASLDRSLSHVANYLPALEIRGPLLIKVGEFSRAETDLLKVLEARPNSPEVHALLGEALAGQGNFEAAARLFEKNLNLEFHRAETLFQLGFCALRLNKNDEAIGKLSQAIEQRPNYPRAMLMRGVAQLNSGKINAAGKDFQASIEMSDSPLAEMHYYLGVALEMQNRFPESLASYNAAIRTDADHIPSRLNRSILLTQSGAYDKALDDTTLVLRLAGSNPVALNNHGVVLNAVGKSDKAIDSFSAAIKQAPDYAEAWFNRGQLLFRQQSFEKSIVDLNRAIEIEPNAVEYWLVRAQAKMQLANYTSAKIDAETALKLDPQNGSAAELLKVLSSANSNSE